LKPVVAFQRKQSDDDEYLTSGNGGHVISGSSPYDLDLYCPAYLPDGAHITNFTIYYYDNDASENLTIAGPGL
jgi:hypothetical protein